MEVGQKDIYRTDEPPLLARRRPIPQLPPSPLAYRRAEKGAMLRSNTDSRIRIRRRRGEHSPTAVALNKTMWLGLLAVVALYAGFLVYAQRKGLFKAKPPAPPVAEAAVPEPMAPIPLKTIQTDVPIENDIKNWKRALTLVRDGAAQAEAGKTALATEKLQEAAELAPDMVVVREELARLWEREKDLAAAEREWRAVLARDPEHYLARHRLAGVYLAAGEYGAALDTARWALESDSYSKEGLDIAAASLMALRQPREAIDYLRRLTAIDRDDPAVRNKLALAYMEAGDFKNAKSVFREVLRSDPGNSVAAYNLAVLCARNDAPAEAVEILIDAIRRFGAPFVLAWTRSTDFDPIRETPVFKALIEHQTAQPAAEDSSTGVVPSPTS